MCKLCSSLVAIQHLNLQYGHCKLNTFGPACYINRIAIYDIRRLDEVHMATWARWHSG